MYMGEGAEACVSEWGECPVCRSGPVPVPARAAGAGVAVGTRISRLKGARKVQRHWPRTGIQLPESSFHGGDALNFVLRLRLEKFKLSRRATPQSPD